jgi:hypothetical protein
LSQIALWESFAEHPLVPTSYTAAVSVFVTRLALGWGWLLSPPQPLAAQLCVRPLLWQVPSISALSASNPLHFHVSIPSGFNDTTNQSSAKGE